MSETLQEGKRLWKFTVKEGKTLDLWISTLSPDLKGAVLSSLDGPRIYNRRLLMARRSEMFAVFFSLFDALEGSQHQKFVLMGSPSNLVALLRKRAAPALPFKKKGRPKNWRRVRDVETGDEWLSAAALAEYLGVSSALVYSHLRSKAGRLRGSRFEYVKKKWSDQ